MIKNNETDYKYSKEMGFFTQMKSWMAINPTYGCPWDCGYCVQHKDELYNKDGRYKEVKDLKLNGKVMSSLDVVVKMMENPRINNSTPITFFNFSDPFLPQNESKLVDILNNLEDRNFRNPVGLITRTAPSNKTIKNISSLRNLTPIIFVSYAGYEDPIEHAPNSKRIEMMDAFHSEGVRVIDYLRPLAKEWIEDGQLERVRENVKDKVNGIVMSGIRLTPEIVTKLNEKKIPIPYTPNHRKKYLSQEIQEKVLSIFKNSGIPVFRHTSCATSYLLRRPDYNAHTGYFALNNGVIGCDLPCVDYHKKFCVNENNFDEEFFIHLKKKVGLSSSYSINRQKKVISIPEEVTKEIKTFLRHNIAYHIETGVKE
jgi:DNA repair photolyase